MEGSQETPKPSPAFISLDEFGPEAAEAFAFAADYAEKYSPGAEEAKEAREKEALWVRMGEEVAAGIRGEGSEFYKGFISSMASVSEQLAMYAIACACSEHEVNIMNSEAMNSFSNNHDGHDHDSHSHLHKEDDDEEEHPRTGSKRARRSSAFSGLFVTSSHRSSQPPLGLMGILLPKKTKVH